VSNIWRVLEAPKRVVHSAAVKATRSGQVPAAASTAARLLPVLVAVSGATALIYESLWMRSFGLIFGNTTDAVAVVLAVFMGGLATGGFLVARRRAALPLRAYGLVELGIGASALVTVPLLSLLPRAYGALAARAALSAPVELAGRALLTCLVVVPPTVLLGATVPLVVEFLSRNGRGFRASFGRLYLVNTLGGAAGVFAGAFVLVPALGITASLVLAALLNLTIGGIAWRWSRDAAAAVPPHDPPATPAGPSAGRRATFDLALLALVSGACSFGLEVLWTRSYALVIGSSVYAFNLMLLAVLLGIAGGTALYARWSQVVSDPRRSLATLFVLLAVGVLLGGAVIGWLPVAFLAIVKVLPASFAAQQAAGFALCLVTMLPVTAILGVTFPLLAHLVSSEANGAQETSGRLYAWNTAGAIAGALATDFVLVGRLGLQGSFLPLAVLPWLAGLWLLGRRATDGGGLLAGSLATGTAALLLVVRGGGLWDPLVASSGVYLYGLDWKDRMSSAFDLPSYLARERRLLFYAEGREAVVAVAERPSGRRFLSVNGKTDAGNGTEDVVTQKFIAHVPLLLHPAPRRALVVGWGAGATAASAALHPLESLECVEIEPATYTAASFFADLNGPLRSDPRFRMVFGDGRNHLLRASARYDVIVSEPSNPWISGVSNLFTEEFYAIVRDRLANGGVFGQWFHYYNLEPGDVKVELKTFLRVFPEASVWLVPPMKAAPGAEASLGADMLLVGSREPHAFDAENLRRAFGGGAVGRDLAATGVVPDETALMATWAMGRADVERYAEDAALFPGGTPLNTDDRPYIEFQAPRRTVMLPADVARAAIAQYVSLAEAASDVRPPVRRHPALEAGGTAAAAFLRDLAMRQADAALPGRARRRSRSTPRRLPPRRGWERSSSSAANPPKPSAGCARPSGSTLRTRRRSSSSAVSSSTARTTPRPRPFTAR
jgi:spermidine synthase